MRSFAKSTLRAPAHYASCLHVIPAAVTLQSASQHLNKEALSRASLSWEGTCGEQPANTAKQGACTWVVWATCLNLCLEFPVLHRLNVMVLWFLVLKDLNAISGTQLFWWLALYTHRYTQRLFLSVDQNKNSTRAIWDYQIHRYYWGRILSSEKSLL